MKEFTLPIREPDAGATVTFFVDWGDGDTEVISYNEGNYAANGRFTHEYVDSNGNDLSASEFTIKIHPVSGQKFGKYWGYLNGNAKGYADRTKLKEIKKWGCFEFGSIGHSFSGCSNLNISATDTISGTPSFYPSSLVSAFKNCTSLNPAGISAAAETAFNSFNTSAAVSMEHTFLGCTSFNTNINNWNVLSVTNFNSTFSGATNFNPSNGLNDWTLKTISSGSGITMQSTFYEATSFNKPLSNWDTSRVMNLTSAFNRASAFNQDISGWNVSNATSMVRMFELATSFNNNDAVMDWGNNDGGANWEVTNMSDMFNGAQAFNQSLANWDTEKVTNLHGTFKNAYSFNNGGQDLHIDTAEVLDMSGTFQGAVNFNRDISSWNTSKVTNMSKMFKGATNFNRILEHPTTEQSHHGDSYKPWDTSLVTDMSEAFEGASDFNQNIASWNIIDVTDATGMFEGSGQNAANATATSDGWQAQVVQEQQSNPSYTSPAATQAQAAVPEAPVWSSNLVNNSTFTSAEGTELLATNLTQWVTWDSDDAGTITLVEHPSHQNDNTYLVWSYNNGGSVSHVSSGGFDFENPQDAGGYNIYTVNLRATDVNGLHADCPIKFTVTNDTSDDSTEYKLELIRAVDRWAALDYNNVTKSTSTTHNSSFYNWAMPENGDGVILVKSGAAFSMFAYGGSLWPKNSDKIYVRNGIDVNLGPGETSNGRITADQFDVLPDRADGDWTTGNRNPGISEICKSHYNNSIISNRNFYIVLEPGATLVWPQNSVASVSSPADMRQNDTSPWLEAYFEADRKYQPQKMVLTIVAQDGSRVIGASSNSGSGDLYTRYIYNNDFTICLRFGKEESFHARFEAAKEKQINQGLSAAAAGDNQFMNLGPSHRGLFYPGDYGVTQGAAIDGLIPSASIGTRYSSDNYGNNNTLSEKYFQIIYPMDDPGETITLDDVSKLSHESATLPTFNLKEPGHSVAHSKYGENLVFFGKFDNSDSDRLKSFAWHHGDTIEWPSFKIEEGNQTLWDTESGGSQGGMPQPNGTYTWNESTEQYEEAGFTPSGPPGQGLGKTIKKISTTFWGYFYDMTLAYSAEVPNENSNPWDAEWNFSETSFDVNPSIGITAELISRGSFITSNGYPRANIKRCSGGNNWTGGGSILGGITLAGGVNEVLQPNGCVYRSDLDSYHSVYIDDGVRVESNTIPPDQSNGSRAGVDNDSFTICADKTVAELTQLKIARDFSTSSSPITANLLDVFSNKDYFINTFKQWNSPENIDRKMKLSGVTVNNTGSFNGKLYPSIPSGADPSVAGETSFTFICIKAGAEESMIKSTEWPLNPEYGKILGVVKHLNSGEIDLSPGGPLGSGAIWSEAEAGDKIRVLSSDGLITEFPLANGSTGVSEADKLVLEYTLNSDAPMDVLDTAFLYHYRDNRYPALTSADDRSNLFNCRNFKKECGYSSPWGGPWVEANITEARLTPREGLSPTTNPNIFDRLKTPGALVTHGEWKNANGGGGGSSQGWLTGGFPLMTGIKDVASCDNSNFLINENDELIFVGKWNGISSVVPYLVDTNVSKISCWGGYDSNSGGMAVYLKGGNAYYTGKTNSNLGGFIQQNLETPAGGSGDAIQWITPCEYPPPGAVDADGNSLYNASYWDAFEKSIKITGLPNSISDVVFAQEHILFLDGATDNLYGLGKNNYSQMKAGTTDIATPEIISTNVMKVACGERHTLILKNDGTLECLGGASQGAGSDAVIPASHQGSIVDIACGDMHSLYVRSNGEGYSFGRAYQGSLGTGSSESGVAYTTPQLFHSNCNRVWAGEDLSFVKEQDGRVLAFGRDNNGFAKGNTSGTDILVPTLSWEAKYNIQKISISNNACMTLTGSNSSGVPVGLAYVGASSARHTSYLDFNYKGSTGMHGAKIRVPVQQYDPFAAPTVAYVSQAAFWNQAYGGIDVTKNMCSMNYNKEDEYVILQLNHEGVQVEWGDGQTESFDPTPWWRSASLIFHKYDKNHASYPNFTVKAHGFIKALGHKRHQTVNPASVSSADKNVNGISAPVYVDLQGDFSSWAVDRDQNTRSNPDAEMYGGITQDSGQTVKSYGTVVSCGGSAYALSQKNLIRIESMPKDGEHLESLAYGFRDACNLEHVPTLANLNAEYFQSAFYRCIKFNQDISTWGISKVNFKGQYPFQDFLQATFAFNSPIPKIEDNPTFCAPSHGHKPFYRLFYQAHAFNQDISSLLTPYDGKGIRFHNTFESAWKFNQNVNRPLYLIGESSKVFASAFSFNQPLDNWVIKYSNSGTRQDYFFQYAINFNQDLSGWDFHDPDRLKANNNSVGMAFEDMQILDQTNGYSNYMGSYMFEGAYSFNNGGASCQPWIDNITAWKAKAILDDFDSANNNLWRGSLTYSFKNSGFNPPMAAEYLNEVWSEVSSTGDTLYALSYSAVDVSYASLTNLPWGTHSWGPWHSSSNSISQSNYEDSITYLNNYFDNFTGASADGSGGLTGNGFILRAYHAKYGASFAAAREELNNRAGINLYDGGPA